MRIVSWNMGCGFRGHGYRAHHAEAWDRLRALSFDLALLQEVVLARLTADEACGRAVVAQTSAGAVTGTAIVCREGTLTESFSLDGGQTVVGARWTRGDETLLVVSAHVLAAGDQITVLTDLARTLASRRGNDRYVVGGDFNAIPGWARDYYGPFFREMEERGFRERVPTRDGVPHRTYWGKQPGVSRPGPPIQDDHVFTDLATFDRYRVCEVLDDPDWHRLSDHAPLVVTLDDR